MNSSKNTTDLKPTSYPRQKGLTCGEYNIRAILDAFGYKYDPPTSPPIRIRLFGYSYVSDISKKLESYGLHAPVEYAIRMSDGDRIELLNRIIDDGNPILLAIGNGHLKRGYNSRLLRMIIGHFVTIYGYDNDRREYYIYDPWLSPDSTLDIPIGNEVRPYNELLADWKGPVYYGLTGMKNIYIQISKR